MSSWKAPDGVGSIEVLDVFGDDRMVVNAARVSFNKTIEKIEPRDEKLIQYLAEHEHTSPFFHPQIQLRIKMPIFVAREWFRHTVGFSRNEVSRRYVDSVPELWIPLPENLRERDPKLKQGSKSTATDNAPAIVEEMKLHAQSCLDMYTSLLNQNVAPEIARSVLPMGLYTEFIETSSLAGYARLWKLRTGEGAQKEIQDYARAVESLLTPHFPVSWKALTATV